MFCDANLLLKIKNNIVKLLFRGENAISMHFQELILWLASALKFVISELCDVHKIMRQAASGSCRLCSKTSVRHNISAAAS
jgi:hypothetical protein